MAVSRVVVSDEELVRLMEPHLTQYLFNKFSDKEGFSGCLSELLKFLYLSSKYPDLKKNFIPVTQEVDDLWHAVILQTVYYQKLCSRLPGGMMIHHESLPFTEYKAAASKESLVDEILRWLARYVENFGYLREDRIHHWFFIRSAKQALGISLDELNRLAEKDTYFKSGERFDLSKGLECMPWGSLSANVFGAEVVRLAAGTRVERSGEVGRVLFVTEGLGTLRFREESYRFQSGLSYLLPSDSFYAVEANVDLVFISTATYQPSRDNGRPVEKHVLDGSRSHNC